MENIYGKLAARTGGNIYIGVVGPVRTGKSTLIKRIMEQLVIPNIEDPYRAERARDELPQSGSGRTIMTSEPKFVPEEAVEISPDGTARLRVRMIDSVGYMVDGAVGAEENGVPRMVTTPWYDREIPMTEAAELGTKKVMEEHCSIGLVVTTDGSVTDIPRADYMAAERRAITDMKATGKPFLVVVNTREPASDAARGVREYLHSEFGVDAAVADCQALDVGGIGELLAKLLYTFPMRELRVHLPRWMDALEQEHPVKAAVYSALLEKGAAVKSLGEAEAALAELEAVEGVQEVGLRSIEPGSGTVTCVLRLPEELFYEILSAKTEIPISTDGELMAVLISLSQIKQKYDAIADALSAVQATGYGVVMPTAEQMKLEPPEIIRKGSTYGVKMRAGAPSIHMIRVDIDTEISPMVGDEKQSRDLVDHLTGESAENLWQSNIFGKSVYELIREGLTAKLVGLPEDVRSKLRGSLTRIVNEGANGLICLIL